MIGRYVIKLTGCDDTTRVVVGLTPAEHRIIKSIADLATREGGGCKPTMSIEREESPYSPGEDDER